MCMMSMLMLLSVPLMLVYASHSDLLYDENEYSLNKFSLGNMGGSEAICTVQSLSESTPINLICTTGIISIDTISHNSGLPIFDVGLIPRHSKNHQHCSNDAFNDQRNCSDKIDRDKVRAKLQEKCVGKTNCSIQKDEDILPNLTSRYTPR